MKFYAVRRGHQPGIYRSWKECQAQVHGYSGASFKSFKSQREAEIFLKGEITNPPQNLPTGNLISPVKTPPETLSIYVDGSHIKGTTRLGYGVLCQHEGHEYALSCHPVTSQDLKSLLGQSIDLHRLSNPTMEFIAVSHILSLLATTNPSRFKRVKIHYDYIGSEKWVNGEWKSHQPHIQLVYNFLMPYVDLLKSLGVQLQWIHVRAHSGHRENDMADALAKGELIPVERGDGLKPLSDLFQL